MAWDAGGIGACHGTSGFLTGCPSASLNASGKWGAHYFGGTALRYQLSLLDVDPERLENAPENSRVRAVFDSTPDV